MEELAENNRCCDNGRFNEAHACQKGCPPPGTPEGPAVERQAVLVTGIVNEPPRQRGRPKGFDGTRSRMPSALAQAFKQNGLDWKVDFSNAIKENKRERIKLWLRLLPYMITTTKRAKVSKWKGKPSKAARIALEAMEQDI